MEKKRAYTPTGVFGMKNDMLTGSVIFWNKKGYAVFWNEIQYRIPFCYFIPAAKRSIHVLGAYSIIFFSISFIIFKIIITRFLVTLYFLQSVECPVAFQFPAILNYLATALPTLTMYASSASFFLVHTSLVFVRFYIALLDSPAQKVIGCVNKRYFHELNKHKCIV